MMQNVLARHKMLAAALAAGSGLASKPTAASERACTPREAAVERLRRCLESYGRCSTGLALAVEDGNRVAEKKNALDKVLSKRSDIAAILQPKVAESDKARVVSEALRDCKDSDVLKAVGLIEALYAEARPDTRKTEAKDGLSPGIRYVLNGIALQTEGDEATRLESTVGDLHTEAVDSSSRKVSRARDVLQDSLADMLERVRDMELLQWGEDLPLVGRALEILYANAGLIRKEFNPKQRAKAMLASIEASNNIRGIITSDELDGRKMQILLACNISDISVLMESGEHGKLVSQALEILAWSGNRRMELPAIVLTIMRAGGEKQVEIPDEIAEAARANVSSLVTTVESITGDGRRTEQVRGQAVTNLAVAHGDMLVLEAARDTPSGKPEDLALLRKALGIVIADHQGASRELAAELMLARLDGGGQP
jgi:hypothetical protein